MSIILNGINGEARLLNHFRILLNSYRQQWEGMIYHYTSPHSLQSILNNDAEGKKDIILWASRYDCLNDESEGTTATKVYDEVAELLYELGDLTERMYRFCKLAKRIKIESTERFITSFSKNPDSLAMWKYYSKGNGYEGINIGLNLAKVWNSFKQDDAEDGCLSIVPVVYKYETQKEIIARSIKLLQRVFANELDFDYPMEDVEVVYYLSEFLTNWNLMFKSDQFQHEEEVRIIVDVPRKRRGSKPIVPIEYRYSNGLWIPYIKIHIKPGALEEITLGPSGINAKQKNQQKNIVHDMIAAKGFKVKTLEYSKIPLRY